MDVSSWSQGLEEPTRTAFLNIQLKELVVPPEPLLTHPFARDLSSEKRFELATGTIVKAVKERTNVAASEPQRPRRWSRVVDDWLWRLVRPR
jgi:hypothetical protein